LNLSYPSDSGQRLSEVGHVTGAFLPGRGSGFQKTAPGAVFPQKLPPSGRGADLKFAEKPRNN